MIARFWDGTVPAHTADDYSAYLSSTGVRDLEATQGNRSVFVLRHFEVLHAPGVEP